MTISAHHGRDLAVAPGGPRFSVFGGQRLDAIDDRRGPGAFKRVAGVQSSTSSPIGAFGDAGQRGEPRNRQPRCFS
jgi:hypothetical protein